MMSWLATVSSMTVSTINGVNSKCKIGKIKLNEIILTRKYEDNFQYNNEYIRNVESVVLFDWNRTNFIYHSIF